MVKSNSKVEALKKVTIHIMAGNQRERMDLMPKPVAFEWVAGVDLAGFTPFEYALLEKRVGDTVLMEIAGWRIEEMFGRMPIPLPDNAKAMERFFLQVEIQAVAPADQKEVVRAMAGMIGECGGDCCGIH